MKLNSCDVLTPFFSLKDKKYKAKVVHVYDGDTIHVVFKYTGDYCKFKIRMLGYNAPEMAPSKKLADRDEIIAKAVAAKNRLEELTLNKIVYLTCDEFDDFGRILGTVKLNINDDISVNDLMLSEGHGTVFLNN